MHNINTSSKFKSLSKLDILINNYLFFIRKPDFGKLLQKTIDTTIIHFIYYCNYSPLNDDGVVLMHRRVVMFEYNKVEFRLMN